MNETPRVRFAPSPTGFLHVGGARTALFNWLYARHHDGVFILRIEDTDLERSSQEMVDAITGGLRWLGIDWDEGPIFQAEQVEKHREAALGMLETGHAYRCFCDPEQLEEERLDAREKGDSWRYDGVCRRIDPGESKERAESGEPYAVRFKVPHEETVRFHDHIHGDMQVDAIQVEDFVMLRGDGQPTYQLAVVVDDADMGVTLVMRGDDHLSNTPKQVMLYRAMGSRVPDFAHLPLILGPDKKRLSKRHGATSVEEYRQKGYLSEAVVNFLSLLGWSPGDDREFLRREELVELFSLERVLKKPSVFDEEKLEWLNGQYLNLLPSEELAGKAREAFAEAGFDVEEKSDAFMTRVVDLLKERVRLFTDFPEQGDFFFKAPLGYDPEAVAKRWKKPEEVIPRLERSLEQARADEVWTEKSIETWIRGLAEAEEVGAGKYIHPIRVAMTGRHTGPGLFELMALLGQDEVVQRLDRAIAWLEETHGEG
ncbi:MAG: glutamate--tRNA ligase [bacterium]